MYPSTAIVASGCDYKGADDDVVKRLSEFLTDCCAAKMVYKTDQESPLKACIEDTLRSTSRSGVFESYKATPEFSAVGESTTNGLAEELCKLSKICFEP